MSTMYKDVAEVIEKLKPSQPVYCFAPHKVRAKAQSFLTNFPGTVAWAVKSNPHPLVVKTVYEAGVRDFDVASLAEVAQIHVVCPGARLHFNHPVKAPEAIVAAYHQYDVRNFSVDHKDEVEKIAALIDKPADVTLLVRFFDPAIVPSSNYNFGKKFGATPEEAVALLVQAHTAGFKVGLAFHPGTQYHDPAIYQHLLSVARQIGQRAKQQAGVDIVRVNVGGGFPAFYPDENLPEERRYFETIQQAVEDVRASFFGENCEFICEPGRALVADSTSLITRIELKRDDGRVHINDGFYGGLMEQQFVDFAPPVRAIQQEGRVLTAANDDMDYTLLGPTCDSIDIMRKQYRLPRAIRTGDYIEFGLMGAYTNASATRFNGFEPAGMVCVEELTDWMYSAKVPSRTPANLNKPEVK